MNRYLPFFFVLLLCAAGLVSNPLPAGELAAGKAKAEAVCQTCHGVDGQATVVMVPNLSGQPKEYLTAQLANYRSGKRRHEQMSIIAKMLSDDDIENLAEWYSSIRVTVEMPE